MVNARGPGVREPVMTTRQLRAAGLSKRDIAAAVDAGHIRRAWRGVYFSPAMSELTQRALVAGGRSACISSLAAAGIFVADVGSTHIHVQPTASRLPDAGSAFRRHRSTLVRRPHPLSAHVHVIDALIQATNCQTPRAAVATLDSALFLGCIDIDDLDEIFAHVAPRRRVLRSFVDGRAESGTETLVRLIARALGFSVELQVNIPGVGRVDLLLDGWLVVEVDSEQHHAGWATQKKDRRRDLTLAARGYITLRPIAEDALHHPEVIVAALRGIRRGV